LSAPLIGITVNCDHEQGRYWLPRDYCRCVREAGGAPVLLPPVSDSQAPLLLSRLDGLLLSGGGDVAPLFYGEEPRQGLGDVDAERDAWEIKLAREALRSGLPLLGICRGLQLLNVALGGSIIQHLSGPAFLQHIQQAPRHCPSHTVAVSPFTRLADLLGGGGSVAVNSFHHQAVCEPAPGLQVCAVAPDGVVEALESKADSFVMAVQWHPENIDHPASKALFNALVRGGV
jgi:putative glutamine amidotransferase